MRHFRIYLTLALLAVFLAGSFDLHAATHASSTSSPISVDAVHAQQAAHFEASELAYHEPCSGCLLRSQWGGETESSRIGPSSPPSPSWATAATSPTGPDLSSDSRPRAPPAS